MPPRFANCVPPPPVGSERCSTPRLGKPVASVGAPPPGKGALDVALAARGESKTELSGRASREGLSAPGDNRSNAGCRPLLRVLGPAPKLGSGLENGSCSQSTLYPAAARLRAPVARGHGLLQGQALPRRVAAGPGQEHCSVYSWNCRIRPASYGF